METKQSSGYHWLVDIVAIMIVFCSVGLCINSFSVFYPFIREFIGLTDQDTSRLLSIKNGATVVSLFIVNIVSKKIGLRNTIAIGMVLGLASSIVFFLARGYSMFVLGSILGGLCHTFAGMIVISALINNWFESHKGAALGLATAAMGLAGTIMPSIITKIVLSTSLQGAFLFETVVFVIVTVLAYIIIREHPSDKGLEPLRTPENKKSNAVTKQYVKKYPYRGDRVAEIISLIWILLMGTSIYGTYQHMSLLYTDTGYDAMFISALIGFCGAMNLLGKASYGFLVDRFGARVIQFIWTMMEIVAAGCLYMCGLTGNTMFAWAGAFLEGFGMAIANLGVSLYTADLYEGDDYLRVLKNFNIAYMLGGILGPELTGMIANATGSYVPSFLVHLFLMAASLIITTFVYIRSVNIAKKEVAGATSASVSET